MKLSLMIMLVTSSVFADKYLLMEPQVRQIIPQEILSKIPTRIAKSNGTTVLKVTEKTASYISHLVHEKFKKCGGYFAFDTENEVANFIKTSRSRRSGKDPRIDENFPTTINQSATVQNLVNSVEEIKIRDVITHLSSYKNRFYTSPSGVEAAKWIASKWKNILRNRSDANIQIYNHRFAQPSVIAKIEGKTKNAIVIGGHLDSIQGYGGNHVHAPGADDNASGIATITEILRVFASSSMKPEKTIFIMGYAGEEKGLLGSKDIAKEFTRSDFGYKIKAAMQFDMTNFNGSTEDMYFITDHTSNNLTNYLIKLNEAYVGANWGKSKCGYACSDHASWTAMGVPAAFPFESTFRGANSKIHTTSDLIDASQGTADHAVNFAKLGASFVFDYAFR